MLRICSPPVTMTTHDESPFEMADSQEVISGINELALSSLRIYLKLLQGPKIQRCPTWQTQLKVGYQ